MSQKSGGKLVLGIDYGTDSCRAVIIDTDDGNEIAEAVTRYPRWAEGKFCESGKNVFRQHPLDYVESLQAVMNGLRDKAGTETLSAIQGLSIDTTGSTPCAVDAAGTPLSLLPEFAQDPDAMFILWKDHSAIDEATAINRAAKSWGGEDFTKYEGGIYSSEWFWAKVMHVIKVNPGVAAAAHSFVEHCDWMPALLTGTHGLDAIKRSRCAMGHKAMWHAGFGGYPTDEFLNLLHPELSRIRATLGNETWTSDTTCGQLTEAWAEKLHLTSGIPVTVGAIDAHMGAVGGGVREGVLVKVMGTSTCDMIVGPRPGADEKLVGGICGQVDGSIIPSMLGYEAGQSAFGDVYAWFKKLLSWPIETLLPDKAEEIGSRLMEALEKEAALIDAASSLPLALDWLNGRRTPDANQLLKGAITGLTLGTTAPMIYRALIEATAFGSRAIVERFRSEGVRIDRIVAIGGVAKKSPLVMQIVADVLGMPIDIVTGDQSVALGAAMFASVVAGIHPTIAEAQRRMLPPVERVIEPNKELAVLYDERYGKYVEFGRFIEGKLT
ncbi:MAG: ribulokinase [Spirochaetae bacterium HGW-Spirochaetae-9]|nr:MAG: ribulokinase [Spirochaetae bacterium HGW-Spirochaetae-9]